MQGGFPSIHSSEVLDLQSGLVIFNMGHLRDSIGFRDTTHIVVRPLLIRQSKSKGHLMLFYQTREDDNYSV